MDAAPPERPLLDRFQRRSLFYGRNGFPCLPSARDQILDAIRQQLSAHGRTIAAEEQAALGKMLATKLAQGFAASAQNMLIVEYESDRELPFKVRFTVEYQTIADYNQWLSTRTAPHFGTMPDARLVALINERGAEGCRVLDVGAGTGRNTIALALLGCTVDAVEMNPAFFAVLQSTDQQMRLRQRDYPQSGERVPRLLCADFLDTAVALPRAPYDVVVFAEVLSSHTRGPADLVRFLQRSGACLAPGGQVLFSVFLVRDEASVLSSFARELGQHTLTCVHSRQELNAALGSAGLTLVADDPVLAYEKANQPAAAWPPTSWFEAWAEGRDLYRVPSDQLPPIELRWIVARKA